MIHGGEVIARALRELGVDHVFGVPGTQNVALLEGFRRASVSFVSAVSEVGALFMANGFFRASGNPGVATTIGGPGFTTALTGVAEARHDSAGVLWIVTSAPPPEDRRFGLQVLDEAAMARPIVKQVVAANSAVGCQQLVGQAYRDTVCGEPGPVLLQLDSRELEKAVEEPPPLAHPTPRRDNAARSEKLILLEKRVRAAKKIVLYLGQGAAEAADGIRTLARRWNAPVMASTSGRGTVPEDDPLSVRVDHPGADRKPVYELLAQADLILVLGCKLSYNGSHGFQLPLTREQLVHVDTDPEVLEANFATALPIHGTVASVVEHLLTLNVCPMQGAGWTPDELGACAKELEEGMDDSDSRLRIPAASPSNISGFFRALGRTLPRDAILVTDSGRHQMLARRHHRVLERRGLIVPSDFQSMGFGIPAAIGARLAAPSRTVVALVGDGGFCMTGTELLTAVREGMTLLVIVFSDGELGLIRDQQTGSWGRSVGTSLAPLRPGALAEAVGARHVLLQGDLEESLARVLKLSGITVAELPLDPTLSGLSYRLEGWARGSLHRRMGPRLLSLVRKLRARGGR